jgi:hypothetical protein
VSAEEFGLFEEVGVQAAACVEDFEADESASFQSRAMNPSTAGGVPAPAEGEEKLALRRRGERRT